jgi:hypothetical protein
MTSNGVEPSEKSAEAVVAADVGRRAERGEVFEAMSMRGARRQMSAQAERDVDRHGEAGPVAASDEAVCPRQGTEGTGSELVRAALTKENLQRAWKRVKANKGSAGVDGLDITQTAALLATRWSSIRDQLLRGTYRPRPVRRVMIPKPDGGERELGIPTVTDRLIQQALLQVLQPILDPTFSEHSHGASGLVGVPTTQSLRRKATSGRGGGSWWTSIWRSSSIRSTMTS